MSVDISEAHIPTPDELRAQSLYGLSRQDLLQPYGSTLNVPGIGTFTIAGQSRQMVPAETDLTPRETVVKTEDQTGYGGDFGLVKRVGNEGVVIVLADPVSATGENGILEAKHFLQEAYFTTRDSPSDIDHVIRTILNIARRANQRIMLRPTETKGSYTFAVWVIQPGKDIKGYLMGDAGNCYIQGKGFRPEGNLMRFGVKTSAGRYSPHQVGYSRNFDSELQTINIPLRDTAGQRVLFATDIMRKAAGMGEGAEQWPAGVSSDFERFVNSPDSARIFLEAAAGRDDGVAVYADLSLMRPSASSPVAGSDFPDSGYNNPSSGRNE